MVENQSYFGIVSLIKVWNVDALVHVEGIMKKHVYRDVLKMNLLENANII